ncbi:hypothetical protein QL285_020681 [Trifolium repens]|nr:hypothetical protein QL285_020681 [Trifolium repens]
MKDSAGRLGAVRHKVNCWNQRAKFRWVSSPIVFKVGYNCRALRTDFQCMIPDGWVGDRIITMMTNAITWNQKNTYNKETQVDLNTKSEMLEFMFGDQFMPRINKLKLIYVPIEDHDLYHWYLMVINLPEKKIYHLDTNMADSTTAKKHQKIYSVAAALSQLALSIFENDIPYCTFPDFDGWAIVEPRGIPNYGHREVLIEVAKELWINLHVKRDEAQMLKKQKRWPSAQGSKTCDA